jgi:hypothetical protein
MSAPVLARWLIRIGASVTALGVILYFLLDKIVELRVSLAVLNFASTSSLTMTMVGLLVTLIGSVAWARRAPRARVFWWGLSVGVASLLLATLGNINVHGPTGILMFVVFAGALGCVLILAMAADRLGQANGEMIERRL